MSVLSGKRGLGGIMLVVVIAWALGAVVLLTGTLVAAQQIHRDVAIIINPNLNKIQANTAEIRLAQQTRRLTAEIRQAAAPLSGQLAATLRSASSIQATAVSIQGHATPIDTKVASIAQRSTSIDGIAGQIQSNVDSIGGDVAGIGASVNAIGAHVRAILADVEAIGAHGSHVLTSARSIGGTATDIRGKLGGINHRALTVISIARRIAGNLAAVEADVGSLSSGIDGHANAIDCSALLNTTVLGAPTTGCGR